MASRLVDKETELRVIGEEKRKIEDELAVLIADRDGDDIQETFRQLEQEREQWLWQREQDLEIKRGEVQKENSGILEREKQRHRQEMERIAEESQQTARLTEEQEKIQEFIRFYARNRSKLDALRLFLLFKAIEPFLARL